MFRIHKIKFLYSRYIIVFFNRLSKNKNIRLHIFGKEKLEQTIEKQSFSRNKLIQKLEIETQGIKNLLSKQKEILIY